MLLSAAMVGKNVFAMMSCPMFEIVMCYSFGENFWKWSNDLCDLKIQDSDLKIDRVLSPFQEGTVYQV